MDDPLLLIMILWYIIDLFLYIQHQDWEGGEWVVCRYWSWILGRYSELGLWSDRPTHLSPQPVKIQRQRLILLKTKTKKRTKTNTKTKTKTKTNRRYNDMPRWDCGRIAQHGQSGPGAHLSEAQLFARQSGPGAKNSGAQPSGDQSA